MSHIGYFSLNPSLSLDLLVRAAVGFFFYFLDFFDSWGLFSFGVLKRRKACFFLFVRGS